MRGEDGAKEKRRDRRESSETVHASKNQKTFGVNSNRNRQHSPQARAQRSACARRQHVHRADRNRTLPYRTMLDHTVPNHTMRYRTIPYLTVPDHTGPYRVVHTAPYMTVPYRATACRTVPYRTVCHTVSHRATPCRTVPQSTMPYRVIPYSTVPHRTVPYSTQRACAVPRHGRKRSFASGAAGSELPQKR